MKFIYKLLIVLIFLTLQSCSKDKKEISKIKELDQELEMISSYEEGMKYLERGDTYYAASKFLDAELLFPQSEWAAKSALMASYSYYLQNYYSEAVFNLERFIKTYPQDKSIAYAHFLLAMCYYEEIVDEKKDLAPLIKAKSKFEFIVTSYPNTDFALDSKYKINLINDILASKEIYIGKHYMKKEKWIAAINRFKTVVDRYSTTIYVEEALHRLVEIYYKIGLEEESRKYASALGYNYMSGDWYKRSYEIFDKNYKNPKKNIKKKGNFITRKFKSLFD